MIGFKRRENTSYTKLTHIYSLRYIYILYYQGLISKHLSLIIFSLKKKKKQKFTSVLTEVELQKFTLNHQTNVRGFIRLSFNYVEINLWLHRTHHLGLRITTLYLFFEWLLAWHPLSSPLFCRRIFFQWS